MRRSGNEELFHCETCTRILYFIEQPASAETAAASAAASANRDIQ